MRAILKATATRPAQDGEAWQEPDGVWFFVGTFSRMRCAAGYAYRVLRSEIVLMPEGGGR